MLIIGHRGARGLAPENTLASLKKALEYEVDVIEFDVRVTKDNVPILHHDAELVDVNGNKLPVANYSYRELKEHKPDLPMLEEAFKTIDGARPLYIEIKPGVEVRPIVDILRGYRHDFRLGSKNQQIFGEIFAGLRDNFPNRRQKIDSCQ